jgi:hypothetical protein
MGERFHRETETIFFKNEKEEKSPSTGAGSPSAEKQPGTRMDKDITTSKRPGSQG